MSYTTNLEIQDEIIGKMGLGVDYYKGEPGEQGIPGKTPVKGVDYFTDAEIAEIEKEVASQITVGAKGEDGKSAYQLAVEAGYEGSETEWLASLKGKDGKDGTNGINGTNGKDGKDGINGIDGKTPVKGVDYFTTAEIQQIEEGAAAKVDTSGYAKTADLSTVATSGSYNDLSNKPSIPEPYELPVASATALGGVKVGSGLSITNGVLSATGGGVADSVEWSKVQNKPTFADVATSGSYDDLTNKPTIPEVPTKVSAFENDKGYLTSHQDLSGYAKKTDIPEVPTKVSAFENDKGYLTEHQSLEGYAKSADLATVAVSGSYNDLADKPTIPSTTGLATETYVDGKIAEIDIPTVPTKVSAFENDKGYLTEHQSLEGYAKKTDIPTVPTNVSAFTNDAGYLTEHQSLTEYAKKTDIPAPYTLPTASTSTLGGVKVDGSTITISNGVISSKGGSGGSEPEKYIKDASVSGNTLTLTKKDDTTVSFTPSGSGSGGVSGYAFTSTQTFTDEDKTHLKEVYINKNIYMTIDKLSVIRIMTLPSKYGFVVINTNGSTQNQVLVYSVNVDNSGNIISDKFTLFITYYLITDSYQPSGTLLTDENYSEFLSINWKYTSDASESNLYNAKEVVLELIGSSQERLWCQAIFNPHECLGNNTSQPFLIKNDTVISGYWDYTGSSIELYNTQFSLQTIYYKT